MAARRRRRSEGGQATVEYAIVTAGVVIPLTFGLIFMAQLLWIWHSVSDFSRDGARYASTHCWQASGSNVQEYLRTHVPAMIDQDQFRSGTADITVQYFAKDAASGQLIEFACDGECTTACVPDVVNVKISNYEFRGFVGYLGIAPVRIPEFQTSSAIESAGCDPEQGICLP